ncbi:MAG TPA: chemotaxis protein CheB [Polyangia bacterium]|nr:chemotaxis protein CheB [Polyangia bacterium]
MRRIRVLVVEDSLTMRRFLTAMLAGDPECEVVGEAADAAGAIRQCEVLRPDVVTLDMLLAGESTGLEVTEHVMAHCPTPILIVSSSFNRGEALKSLDALAAGAVDMLEKPTGKEPEGDWRQAFLDRVKLVSRIRVITHLRGRRRALGQGVMGEAVSEGATRGSALARPRAGRSEPRLIVMGASTGGPGAVAEILGDRAHPVPLPLLLVVHLAPGFGQTFAAWLGEMVPMPVREAVHGAPLPRPDERCVIVAPAEAHLLVEGGLLRLSKGPERHSCRPSIDVLFESVARELGAAAIGCLLTGMGRDGAEGLLAMRNAGAVTVAQDEASSVVFGMPREAIRLGAAGHVLCLPAIAPALVHFASKGGTRAAGVKESS